MDDNAKNVIFKVQNVVIYALFWGKFLKFEKCACVKNLTNMMSGLTLVVSELSMTILIMQKSTSTLTLKSVPNT